MTKTSHLRVYSPEATGSRDPVPGFVRTFGLLSETPGDDTWLAEWEGVPVACPRNLRLRVLESTVAFANAFGGVGGGLIPEGAADAAHDELKAYRRSNPGHRSHVLTSAWHVPVRWFALFDPSEKEIYTHEDTPRIRFRTGLADAIARIRRTQEILVAVGMFAGPAEEVGQLLEWLEPFPEGSMVELDYDQVSELFDPHDLVFDDSCEQISESLGALEAGDLMKAGECYGRVVTRWAPAFAVTFSN